MWNYNYKSLSTDDVDLRNFDADTGAIADHGPLTVERHFLLDHFRRLFWNGPALRRSEARASRTRTATAFKEGLYPIIEPFDLKGVGVARLPLPRSRQAGRPLALPAVAPPRAPALDRAALRRALRPGHRRRQLLRLRRPDRVDGLEVPRREGRCSASFHAEHFPVKWADRRSTGPSTTCGRSATSTSSRASRKLPQYAYSKRVLFIDKEIVRRSPTPTSTTASGELWKIWINDFSFRKKAFAGRRSTYDDEMALRARRSSMVDMQLEHATKASLPSHRFPGEQGWYFNQGEKAGITDDWFTVAALVSAGH